MELIAKNTLRVQNPKGSYPEFDIYKLAPVLDSSPRHLLAIMMDMDGTTTSTEPLCLASLEYMVSSCIEKGRGTFCLDKNNDLKHIIGNSTTKHVEYLLHTYSEKMSEELLLLRFLEASIWMQAFSSDQARKAENAENIRSLGLSEKHMLPHPYSWNDTDALAAHANSIYQIILHERSYISDTKRVNMAIEVYYQHYHYLLMKTQHAENDTCIQPMQYVAEFLALFKGLLGSEVVNVIPVANLKEKRKLEALSIKYEKQPAQIALVTSSIAHEANIVMSRVFQIMQKEASSWELTESRRDTVIESFRSYEVFYDAVVTASDSSEIRLKPHRDLYSLALRRLRIDKIDLKECMGIEDSRAGICALRAAGVGRAMALPFDMTSGHDLSHAARVVHGGLKELILDVLC